MRKDSQEILPDAFEDPQLDCLAYLTFVGVDDKDINFSFIVDANDDQEQKNFLTEGIQADQFSDKVAEKQIQQMKRQSFFLLQERQVKDKSQNLHKSIIRIFLTHFECYAKEENLSPNYFLFMDKICKDIRGIRNESIVLPHLKLIFGEGRDEESASQHQKINRYLLHKIISCKKIMEKEVIKSNYFKEKNRLKHLIGMKVYKYRMKKPSLTGRTQSH